ncbi:MAG: Ig-like domain-containing protein, partial [Ruminococcus sp.]
MRKKQFLQFRRAMATLLAVAMIGQNTVMTTAENYVADNTAVVAEEQAQEPEVQVEEAASPAVQESAPAAETPTEPAAQAVAETPAEPVAQAVAETPAEPAAQAVAETPAEPAAQAVAETPAEPAGQTVAETPVEPADQTVAETPETPAEQEPSVSAETSSGSASQEPAADADKASAAEAESDGNTAPVENPSPELGKEVLYRITFNGDAAAHGTIQVKGETAPVDVASYNKEVKENEKFEFSITAAQGFETERVTLEADGTQLVKNAEGFYEIPAVTKAENILVTYKEIPQESAANTGSTEESEEEPEGEPAEEPIEENTDELEMPVFDYSGSCAGVTAAIYAEEGVLPEGTTVELAPLSDAQIAAAVSVLGCEVSDILGLDITFIYNGEEIQPSGNVAVSFTAAEIADVDVTSVYHVGDDGAVNEVAASQEGSSLGFTTDSFSGYLVNLAGLNGQPSETAITGNTTVAVGETITLTGSGNKKNCSYKQTWSSSDSDTAKISAGNGKSANVTGIKEGTVIITHNYCARDAKNHWEHTERSETIEVTVTAPVYATELLLPETVSVDRGEKVTIAPISLKPENATLTWKSDNSAVATVDSKGIVTGKKPGTATISAQSGDRIATTTVTVKAKSNGSATTGKTWNNVEFYYLKTPTSDKNSNETSQWGTCLGIGTIDLTDAIWDKNNKNTFDNVPARVISWPAGGTVNGSTYDVSKNSTAWNEILSYWKDQVQKNLGIKITNDDIESITLIPYKISDNATYHVDCTIDIKCKRVVTAKYFLWDAGTNVTQYDQVYAKSFVINKGTTQPSDSDKLSLPLTKTVDGKNYTLKAWYRNSSLQGETVTFPYSIGESNVNFYAKYVRSDIKYTVNYYWNGTTEKVADSVTGFGGEPGNVITETPKMINGYTPVSSENKQLVISENGTNEINFYYFKNVELTANSETATYDGKEHSVSGYTGVPEGVSFAGITVGTTGTNAGEYPAAFAKGTVGMTDGTGKYIVSKAIDGKLEIGKAAVTLKSATLSKKYDGNALVNGDTALEIESGFAEGEGATYNFTGSQTVVGSSANAFSYELNSNTNIDNYAISKQEGTLTVTNREAKYEITVKANSATATYDGKEHEAVGVETYEFTVEGNSYTVSGLSTEDPKQKDAGSYTNNITGTPVVTDKEGNVVTSEFEVKTENGSLEIGKAAVTLKSATLSKKYDGNALVNGDTALEIE